VLAKTEKSNSYSIQKVISFRNQREKCTSANNDYAVHSFASLSHSPTFASDTLSAYFITGKRRIVMDVV